MKLKRLNAEKPNFEELNKMLQAMEALLEGEDTSLTIEELLSFQKDDGSFALIDSRKIPNEAIIDFINTPTYMGTAILMKAYLSGNKNVKERLVKGLSYCFKTEFIGHGYDAEKTRINSLNIFIKAGLADFLENERELCPEFHHLIHNILHYYNSNLISENTMGAWGEDYRKDWEEITRKLKSKRRLYLAYGSNMNVDQMVSRCPDAKVVGKAYLKDWVLTMPHVANIEEEKGSQVPVLIWEISEENEIKLNRYEGYPSCYDKKDLSIEINGIETTAMAYIMTEDYKTTDKFVFQEYEERILQGYLDAGFDKNEFKPKYRSDS